MEQNAWSNHSAVLLTAAAVWLKVVLEDYYRDAAQIGGDTM